MLLNLFLWNIFLIPLIHSSNVIYNKTDHDGKETIHVKKTPQEVIHNSTQLIMASEGGSILHDAPAMVLPKTNLTIELMNLDKEMGKAKQKPIQPRKGVGNPLDIAVSQSNSIDDSNIKINDNLKLKFEAALRSHKNSTLVPPAIVTNQTSTQEQTKIQNITTSKAPKKPLKVAYETLAKLEAKFDSDTKIPLVKSSSKTIVNDQMPSPNKEINTKTYSMASKHPGMVTPIVITMLVVPMFAVLGYMALKRGQEAWKNRHYKRMDFLLDGMYND